MGSISVSVNILDICFVAGNGSWVRGAVSDRCSSGCCCVSGELCIGVGGICSEGGSVGKLKGCQGKTKITNYRLLLGTR